MMIRTLCGRLLAKCVVSIAVVIVTMAHAVSGSEFLDADDLVLRLMSRDHILGAALALIRDGRIVLEKGYGFRDQETQAPVTTATLFKT